jgi:hypothetical protein
VRAAHVLHIDVLVACRCDAAVSTIVWMPSNSTDTAERQLVFSWMIRSACEHPVLRSLVHDHSLLAPVANELPAACC